MYRSNLIQSWVLQCKRLKSATRRLSQCQWVHRLTKGLRRNIWIWVSKAQNSASLGEISGTLIRVAPSCRCKSFYFVQSSTPRSTKMSLYCLCESSTTFFCVHPLFWISRLRIASSVTRSVIGCLLYNRPIAYLVTKRSHLTARSQPNLILGNELDPRVFVLAPSSMRRVEKPSTAWDLKANSNGMRIHLLCNDVFQKEWRVDLF